MIALNPLFLWLLPLVGVPVLFHLFLRVKKRSRTFSTLMFFTRADPRLSARRRIRELLALLLRMLAILFLLLALARPVWTGIGGTGPVSLVLILDNSASMSAPGPDGRPKLTAALETAGALLSDMGEKDAAAVVVTADDPAMTLPAYLSSDKTLVRAALDKARETEAGGSPARAMETAFSRLEGRTTARSEIHIFTDLQKHEWGRDAMDLRLPPFGTTVTVHRLDSAPLKAGNVAIAAIKLSRLRVLAGRRATATVSLFNASPLDAAVRVHMTDDEGARSTRQVSVATQRGRTLLLPLKAFSPGIHWVHVWIEDDAFAGDNRASLAFDAGGKEEVLFLGEPDRFGVLPVAISPLGDGLLSGLSPSFTRGVAPADALGKDRPAMVVATWTSLAAMGDGPDGEAVQTFVQEGGTLLVVPSQEAPGAARDMPTWLGATPEESLTSDSGLPVIVFDDASPLWDDLKDREGNVLLRNVKAFRLQALHLAEGTRPVLGLANGKVLLSERPVGAGSVFASGLAYDTRSSNLPLKQGFVAMAQTLALLAPKPGTRVVPLVAGDATLVSTTPGASVRVHAVTGDRLDWQGSGRDLPRFARSGVYVVDDGSNQTYVAVRASDPEGERRFVAGDTAPVLQDLTHRVVACESPQAVAREVRRSRTGFDMFLLLLALTVLSVAAEGWVVNPKPRHGGPARAVADGSEQGAGPGRVTS